MKKSGLFAAAAVMMIVAFASFADAGRIGRAAQPGSLDAQLGVRFAAPLPENLRQGDTFEAQVLNPQKLGGFGLAKVKRGDKVLINVLSEDGKFQIVHEGTLSNQLQLNEQGRIGAAGPAARQLK